MIKLFDSESTVPLFRQVLRKALFFVAYGLFLFVSVDETTLLFPQLSGAFFDCCRIASFVMIAIGELIDWQWSPRDIQLSILCAVLGVAGVGTWNAVGNLSFLLLAAFIWGARRIDYGDVLLETVTIIASMTLIVIMLSQVGILKDNVWPSSRFPSGRHGLGFLYVTDVTHFWLNITCAYLLLRRRHVTIPEILAFLAVNLGLFLATGSRNSTILAMALCLMEIVFKMAHVYPFWGRKVLGVIAMALVIAVPIFSVVLPVAYTQDIGWMTVLNKFMTGRLALQQHSLMTYPVTLFGQPLSLTGAAVGRDGVPVVPSGDVDYAVVDNSVNNTLLYYGAIPLFIMLAVVFIVAWWAWRTRDGLLSLVLIAMLVHALFDPQLFQLQFDVLLVVPAYALSARQKRSLAAHFKETVWG